MSGYFMKSKALSKLRNVTGGTGDCQLQSPLELIMTVCMEKSFWQNT